jgi:predicted transcriptional regulator
MAHDNLTAISRILNTLPHRKEVVRLRDMVKHTSTHCLGGGEWSIELHEGIDDYSPWLAEFVGNNGTRSFVNEEGFLENEEADDLWAEVDEWMEDPERGGAVHHITHWYTLPDGCVLNFHAILREIEKGRLHGLPLSF